ncbi:MAG: cytochrome P450 [Gammaproteobacteria bacterium]|nr:cytochrome P450 [Gammaproteobacteria bacterium]
MNEDLQADWNPLDALTLKDQRRAYDDMRERCPVAYSEFMGWSLFRHEDIVAVLADTETYSNVSQFLAIPNGIDPPVHCQYREPLDANFDQTQMAKFEPNARKIAETLLEPLLYREEVEFIEAFVNPFALKTLCALLGWPEDQWESLGGWVHDSQHSAFKKDPVAGKALASYFSEHVKKNLNNRRASPSNAEDATDALMNTQIEDVQLEDDQIVSILRNWTAGHGTVAAGLGILVLHLAQESELQDSLRSDPSLISTAIEEILRADGPLVANPRTTTRQVEIQGRSIPKGEHLTLMWIAANRDPRSFDEPNAIKVERNTEDSLVWGQGVHLCQGAPLARLEMRVAIEELLARTKRIELTGTDAPCRHVYPSNGLAALTLRLR